MLFDPAKEYFNLPASFIHLGDLFSCNAHGHDANFPTFKIMKDDHTMTLL